ncbi:hypothetical protein ACQEU3_45065 [Spirillospora sp. CA-253888]
MGVYFGVVGLDRADKLGSVIGGLAMLIGPAMTLYGLVSGSGGNRGVSQNARASGGRILQVGGSQTSSTSGSGVVDEVRQRARTRKAGEISQVGGDQNPSAQP